MNKTITLFSLMALISCGKGEIEFNPPADVGELKFFEPVVMESSDQTSIQELCASFDTKVTRLDDSSSEQNRSFNTQSKKCDEESLGPVENVTLTIKKNGGNYLYHQEISTFRFPHIETKTDGDMKVLCNVNFANTTLESPMYLNSDQSEALWFRVIKSGECGPSDRTCIELSKGTRVDDTENYVIHTKNTLKFYQDASDLYNFGHLIERNYSSSMSCTGTDGQTQFIMTEGA